MNEEALKECSKCGLRKSVDAFRVRNDNHKPRNECRQCESDRQKAQTVVKGKVRVEPREPPSNSELIRRMVYAAKNRAKEKGVPFNLEPTDISIPPICPVLRIPIIPSTDGVLTDNSPTLDRQIPHLGYVKDNVQVVSNKCNRLKSNGNSRELECVLEYVKDIEEKLLNG